MKDKEEFIYQIDFNKSNKMLATYKDRIFTFCWFNLCAAPEWRYIEQYCFTVRELFDLLECYSFKDSIRFMLSSRSNKINIKTFDNDTFNEMINELYKFFKNIINKKL